jgi:hypothetical protein
MTINVTPIPKLTVFASPGLTLTTANDGGTALSTIRSDASLLVYDTTIPVASTYGGSSVVGSAATSARRDHKHALTVPTVDVSCLIYNDGDQSIADGAFAYLDFDQEYIDTDTLHNPASNPSRITINEAGLYLIVVNLKFATSTTGDRQARVIKNRSEVLTTASCEGLAGAFGDTSLNFSTIASLAVDDYIEVNAGQNSGGALSVTYAAEWTPNFGVAKITGNL